VQNRKAANANAIVILCTQMIDSPVLVGYAARNAILAAVNAGLPALAASFSGVFVYDNAASMSLGDVNSSGNHPNGGGFNKWGAGLAALVLSKIGGGGLPFPRPVQPRVARARWKSTTEATDTAVVLDDGTKGILPQQGASFAFGKFFRPSTAPQSYQRILMCLGNGTGLAGNVVLLEGPPYAGCAHSSLQLYVDGVSRFQQNDALVQGRSCMIGVNVDRVRGEASIYCLREGDDGKPCTVLVSQVSGVVNWTYTFGKLVAAGTLPGLNGSPGLHGDVWVKPNGLVTVDEMEAAYFEDGIPVGAVSYPLADGSGTAIAPGLSFASYPSGTLTGGSWSAAGAIREPWHRAAHGSIVTGAVSSFADSAAKAWAQSVMAALAASGIAIDTTT